MLNALKNWIKEFMGLIALGFIMNAIKISETDGELIALLILFWVILFVFFKFRDWTK